VGSCFKKEKLESKNAFVFLMPPFKGRVLKTPMNSLKKDWLKALFQKINFISKNLKNPFKNIP